jgi:hypothetical protein
MKEHATHVYNYTIVSIEPHYTFIAEPEMRELGRATFSFQDVSERDIDKIVKGAKFIELKGHLVENGQKYSATWIWFQ